MISGRFFYLGKYGSKASREEYERIIGEYLNNGKKLPPLRNRTEITIEELAVKFLEYTEGYYVQNGRVTETFGHCKLAIGPVVRHYGTHFVSSFGPLALTFIRDKYGLDYTQAVMGHASAKTTEIYAKVAFEKAAEVMREIG